MSPALILVLLSASAFAQGGRFEENKRAGLASVKEGKFDRAAAKLEEVYEADPGDPAVAEGLAIAYLNGDERKLDSKLDEKGRAILEKQLAKGGRAVFLVQLNLSSTFYGSSSTKVCSGPLIVTPGKLEFQCEKGDAKAEHSFTFAPGDIKETGDRFDKGHGMFFVKGSKRTYNFYPASWDKKHSQMVLALVRQYVK
jgi:hypothetical protein